MSVRLEWEEWGLLAQQCRDGESRRAAHHCGPGDVLMVSRQGTSLSAYCFRCGGKGFHREQESLAEKLARVAAEKNADAQAQCSFALPEPRVYTLSEWGRDAALWLYKTGFSPRMIEELGAYWCPMLGRVVLPVMRDGHAIFWQARAITRQPKIISPQMPRRGIVARFGEGRGDTIVLCEDILSAAKVGRETEAWSLLGTKLLDAPFAELLTRGRRVAVWLDDDSGRPGGHNPGQIAAAAIVKRLRGFGIDVRNIKSPRDPKWYDRDFIKGKLCL